jgi:phage terminase large subunit
LYDTPIGSVRWRWTYGGRGGGKSVEIARALVNIVSACYGAFMDILCLHTADESDAILASRLGM